MFQWNDAYSVGVPQLDHEHKSILLIINLLIEHHSEGPEPAFLSGILSELSDYASLHFEHEEALLEERGYPDLPAQRREHQAFRFEIVSHCALLAAEPKDPSVLAEDLYRFLVTWWNAHILESDMKYRTFLAEAQPGHGMAP